MDHNDRRAIEGLFDKLDQVERQAPTRDAQAERFIAEEIGRKPGAPYYMAQTIVMQDQALAQAQARLDELEYQLAQARQQSSGFFGRLFGGAAPRPQMAPRAAAAPQYQHQPAQQGGGFLAGAAQTAMGVAGGMLLANAVGSMFADPAAAAEAPTEAPPDEDMAGFDEMDLGGDDSWE